MTNRIITSDACVAEGAEWLASHDPRLKVAMAETGPLPLRLRESGFPALLHTICAQQLSVAAANSVWEKLCAANATDANSLLAHDDDILRGCGLSRPKVKYARALAEADIDYAALATMPEAEALETLTAVKGIGVWTAEIYLMFSVGRADVLAAGDLALQEAAKVLYALPARPTDKELRELALSWSPWRSVAARILWAYYRISKRREGISEMTT